MFGKYHDHPIRRVSKLEDRNTRYFHTKATLRKKRNEICKIKDEQGMLWENGKGRRFLLKTLSKDSW